MTKVAMSFHQARDLSFRIIGLLSPGCERIEVGGSIRRGKNVVGDVEIIAIPFRIENLYGTKGDSWLDGILAGLEEEGRLKKLKGGDRYKQYFVTRAGCNLDLFIVEPETWGIQYLIRTGPADFSRRMVTQRSKGGNLPDGYRVNEGRIWPPYGEALATPEEHDVFEACGMDFVNPEDRR